MHVAALIFSLVTFVPLDDRPVTRQLPQMLGRIAGQTVVEPPRPLLGNYLLAGKPDRIIAWLNAQSARGSNAFVISADMLAYGGLIASRVPGVTYSDAYFRLNEFTQLRRQHPRAWIGAFGTIMRLAPTGIPDVGPAAKFFAPYPLWQYLQDYANLHDPPLPSELERARHLRDLIGKPVLQAYLDTRERNLAVDLREIDVTQSGAIDTLVLGQDDAGPFGLHLKDVRALQSAVQQQNVGDRVAIEPGADELGMAMVAQALARSVSWTPRVAVDYSTPEGASFNDPLEYAPIDVAIDGLIALCGGRRVPRARADIQLYVRVPDTGAALDSALLDGIGRDEAAHRSVAFADLELSGKHVRGSSALRAAAAPNRRGRQARRLCILEYEREYGWNGGCAGGCRRRGKARRHLRCAGAKRVHLQPHRGRLCISRLRAAGAQCRA